MIAKNNKEKFKENSEIQLEETLSTGIEYEISIIKRFGLFPMYGLPLNENPILFALKYLSNMIITFTFITSIFLNIVVKFNDSAEVIETLYFGLTETTFVSKIINIHLRYKTFRRLAAYLSDPIFNDYTEEQKVLIASAIRKVRIFAQLFRSCVTITIIFFIVFPYLDKRPLVIPSYFPFSVEKYQFLCYIYQLWGIIINGYCHSSLDCVVTGLITVGSAQFEILKNNLNNIRKGLEIPRNDWEHEQQENLVLKRLGKYVKHHIVIIKYAYEIENMFSIVQFVQFLASSIIICVTGFQIILTPITDLKFITLILYFSCNLIQVLMCCWFGHDIKTKSEGVGEACYMSDWYNCGVRVGRSIFIIMERSKRPITLTAGKFFNLTLQTLMQVLKTSYSYLALLRQMNEVERL